MSPSGPGHVAVDCLHQTKERRASAYSRCDGLNVLAFRAPGGAAWSDNFGVVRLDHDFGLKWHFNSTSRYSRMERATRERSSGHWRFFPG